LPTLVVVLALPRLARVWKGFLAPPPAHPPKHYPIWPLWYAAIAFVHVRRAGGLLVVGLVVAAAFNVGYDW
jgi:1,4-dihydroxy-2-naphthoate octaprenyltransferase